MIKEGIFTGLCLVKRRPVRFLAEGKALVRGIFTGLCLVKRRPLNDQ